VYADAHQGQWPAKLSDLDHRNLDPTFGADILPGLEYHRPDTLLAATNANAFANTPMIFETKPVDADGECVGFADGHVEFISQADRLRELRAAVQATESRRSRRSHDETAESLRVAADLQARIRAASSMSSFMGRDQVLAAIAKDAARIGDVENTHSAVGKMTSFTSKDDAICASARLLVAAGKRTSALELAQQVTSFTTRDKLIKELAK